MNDNIFAARCTRFALSGLMAMFQVSCLFAQDWPQWRGVHRDGKIDGFIAPPPWPDRTVPKWRTTVGLGDATPALVGSRLYVFGRQGEEEVIRCLNADDGTAIWRHAYQAVPVTGAAEKYQGPRSSPAVADGKVIALGVGGILTCLDAATGEKIWRKEEYAKDLPLFFTSASPLVAEGLCLIHLGGKDAGVFVAIEISSGKLKWQWTGDGPAYGSPVLMMAAGVKQVVMLTESNLTGLSFEDGKCLWRRPTSLKPGYWNSASPVVEEQTVYYSGQGEGTKAVKIEKQGDEFTVRELWRNEECGTVYNTPVIKDGLLYGLSDRGNIFCLDTSNGRTAWSATNRVSNFGSILDVGAVLVALPEKSGLIAFKPGRHRYDEIARLKVTSTPVYAHPVLAGNRAFVRDAETVSLWMLE
jgi:outer membrane protein assembly factor BamB